MQIMNIRVKMRYINRNLLQFPLKTLPYDEVNLGMCFKQFGRRKTYKCADESNGEKESSINKSSDGEQKDKVIPAVFNQRFKVFRDVDSPEIFDVEEERFRQQQTKDALFNETTDEMDSEYNGLNLKRGLHGIFDIEDLVDVLRQELAEDIFVCRVPKEMAYVDYMVICSGQSYRHMSAIAEYVRYLCKRKRYETDRLPKIEGGKSREWIALDMGNIALHIFSAESREVYDLESLWSIGIEYDREFNRPKDPLIELFEKHSFDIKSLQKPNVTVNVAETLQKNEYMPINNVSTKRS